MHECVISTVATDTLVVKHQAISIHNGPKMFIVNYNKIKLLFGKKMPQLFKGY